MPVTIYESTDASAPVLSGTVGSLVALLDACLVNGYGSKGAAGWTKAFSGTNKAAYRQGAKTGRLQLYLRVQDDAPGAGLAKEARMCGYETMTAVDTGTELFPTAVQMANGVFARKSTTADATAREWILAADHRTFRLHVISGDSLNVYLTIEFGDVRSRVATDQYGVQIIARPAEGAGAGEAWHNIGGSAAYATQSAHYMARAMSGVTGAVQNGKHGETKHTSFGMGSGGVTFPDGAGGKLLLGYMNVHDVTVPAWRGWLRGVWNPQHPADQFTNGDTFTGGGRTFRILKGLGSTSYCYALETSNTWDTD